MTSKRQDLRSVAIVAHVDHGKTTLVDALFQQSGVFHERAELVDRVMDSGDQERERGITISAKTTSVVFHDTTIQIVDTPGHADFGGEVERTLQMVDGIVLLVDAAEGCLPQTRFVLRKAFERELPVIVVVNKIDRSDARPQEVLNEVYDLFIDLGADDDALEFPVVYAIGRDGVAGLEAEKMETNLEPLVQMILKTVPAPDDFSAEPFSMQVNALGYDEYVGRLMIGRVKTGTIKPNDMIKVHMENGKFAQKRVTGLFRFHGTERIPLEAAKCGDIVAVSGVVDVSIGDTISDLETETELPRFSVDEPTVAMVFQVNDGPLSGRSGGKYVTSRHLAERLEKEAFANVAIKVQPGDSPDQFRVLGRGELQLSVVIESLRREKYELCVRTPQVVTREVNGKTEEPMERLVIDVPGEFLGPVSEILGPRKAKMEDQRMEGSRMRLEYLIPTRGLFGLRNVLLTVSRGTAIAHSVFEGWIPWSGPIEKRSRGALVSDRKGKCTPYALYYLQPRGTLYVPPSTEVYEGMIIGQHAKDNDLNVNCVREKKMSNVRSSGKDEATTVSPYSEMTLEKCLEWITDDEMVEVTPEAIRLRKRILQANKRPAKSKSA